jgi:hypothetical protein
LAGDALAAIVEQAVTVGVVIEHRAQIALRGSNRADTRAEDAGGVLSAR